MSPFFIPSLLLVRFPNQSPAFKLEHVESAFFYSTDPGTSPTLQWKVTHSTIYKVDLMVVKNKSKKGEHKNGWVGKRAVHLLGSGRRNEYDQT